MVDDDFIKELKAIHNVSEPLETISYDSSLSEPQKEVADNTSAIVKELKAVRQQLQEKELELQREQRKKPISKLLFFAFGAVFEAVVSALVSKYLS